MLSLTEKAIVAYNQKYLVLSGAYNSVTEGMKDAWRNYQIEFGRIQLEKERAPSRQQSQQGKKK
jgi:hypothetical protein